MSLFYDQPSHSAVKEQQELEELISLLIVLSSYISFRDQGNIEEEV